MAIEYDETRPWDKDLTILVTGLGATNTANLEENLLDWMFGQLETREIRIIVPILSKMGPGMKEFFKWGTSWGFDFTIVQVADAGMTREITALPQESFVKVADDRTALATGMTYLLDDYRKGNEIAFVMIYDENSVYKQGDTHISDREIIGDAKAMQFPLTTLNINGMIDSFEGYESPEEIAAREKAIAEFEQKILDGEIGGAIAKKAVAPRKRAAKKVVAPKSTPALEAPQKPTETPSERPKLPIEELVEQRVPTELSATASLKPVAKEIWDDVAAARSPWDTDSSKDAMLRHAKAVQAMGQAFTDVIGTLVEMMETKNV